MEGENMIRIDAATKRLIVSPELKSVNFFDICDGGGRILHKLEANEDLEYDLSFLSSGSYILWTVCEGCAKQFPFTI